MMSANDRRFGFAPPAEPMSTAGDDALVLASVAADLDARGHAGHLVLLQRLVPSGADPDERRALFWCESCKLWLLALIADPSER